MPPKNTMELADGCIYFKGTDEPLEIHDGEVTDETKYADDQEPYIKLSTEPVEFTLNNVEFARVWTLVKCKDCGYEFPVTEFYILLHGTKGWLCPRCTFIKALEDAKRKENL